MPKAPQDRVADAKIDLSRRFAHGPIDEPDRPHELDLSSLLDLREAQQQRSKPSQRSSDKLDEEE
jgi:hypothetical protein